MIKMQHATKVLGIVLSVLILQGCTSAELAIDFYKKHKRSSQNNSGVVATPHYKIGNPYKEFGVWYYPKRDLTYDETGIASWYGEETSILGQAETLRIRLTSWQCGQRPASMKSCWNECPLVKL